MGGAHETQRDASIAEVGPLLEHTRWILGDLAARIESFNQRPGVLLGVSVAVGALALPAVAGTLPGAASWLGACLVAAPFLAPMSLALTTLLVRSAHGIGPRIIYQMLGPEHYPTGRRGDDIQRDLLRSLTGPAEDGSPSVLADMNSECGRKGKLLRWTQITFGVAVVASGLLLFGLSWSTSSRPSAGSHCEPDQTYPKRS